jgi:hypothetical protein
MLGGLRVAVKWYFRGLFLPSVLVPIFLLMLLFYGLLYGYSLGLGDSGERFRVVYLVVVLASVLLNPLFLASGVAHVARTRDMTVFEVSMFGCWVCVAVSRLAALLVYLAPYMLFQVVALWFFVRGVGGVGLEVGLLLWLSLLFYGGIAVVLSLGGSRVVAVVGSSMLTFLLPTSVLILVGSLTMYRVSSLDVFTSAVLYLFNAPLSYVASYLYGFRMALSWTQGALLLVLVDVLVFAMYVYVFSRKQELKI